MSRLCISPITCLIFSCMAAADVPIRVTVSAGATDRKDAIVSFSYPGLTKGPLQLRDSDGNVTYAWSDGSQARFIVDTLKANTSRTYQLKLPGDADKRPPDVRVRKDTGALIVETGPAETPREILAYQSEKTPLPAGYPAFLQRGGYLSPVNTPSGKLLTDDYPANHKHHHGIWFPWTKTEFEGRHPDFWNMQDKTGRVDPDGVIDAWSGIGCAGIRARHNFIDMTATPEKVALKEEWDLIVYRQLGSAEKPYYVFDLTSTQSAPGSPLVLPKYLYGGLGFRGRADWNGAGDACTMITSEGKTRKDGNQTQAKWIWVGGKADGGGTIGIAILCHPSNFRFPQPVRFHPDMPYVCYAPSQLGDWRIEPGKPYVSRYRFIAADGPADPAQIERLWNEYAQPPAVTVE